MYYGEDNNGIQELNSDSYAFHIICNILTDQPIDKGNLPNLLTYIKSSVNLLKLKAQRSAAIAEGNPVRQETLTESIAFLIRAHLRIPEENPPTQETLIKAQKAMNLYMPDLDVAADPSPEKQKAAAKVLVKILYGLAPPENILADGLYFPLAHTANYSQKYAVRMAPGGTFQEFFLMNINYPNQADFERLQALLAAIPYGQLEQAGIMYHHMNFRFGNQKSTIPFLQSFLDETAVATEKTLAQSMKDLSAYCAQNIDKLAAVEFGEPSLTLEELQKFIGMLRSDSYRVPNINIEELTKVPDNFPGELTHKLQKLYYVHILTYLMNQKRFIAIDEGIGQNARDLFDNDGSPDLILADRSKIFGSGKKTLEDYERYGTSFRNNFVQYMLSLTPEGRERLGKRAETWESSAPFPRNLTHEQLTSILLRHPQVMKSKLIEAHLPRFLNGLKLSDDTLREIHEKTRISESEIASLYYNQVLQMMLIVQQGVENLFDYPVVNKNGGLNKLLIDQNKKLFDGNDDNDRAFRQTRGTIKFQFLDGSMSDLVVEGSTNFNIGTEDNYSGADKPGAVEHWKFNIRLDSDLDQPAVESVVDANIRVSPYMLHLMAVNRFNLQFPK